MMQRATTKVSYEAWVSRTVIQCVTSKVTCRRLVHSTPHSTNYHVHVHVHVMLYGFTGTQLYVRQALRVT